MLEMIVFFMVLFFLKVIRVFECIFLLSVISGLVRFDSICVFIWYLLVNLIEWICRIFELRLVIFSIFLNVM